MATDVEKQEFLAKLRAFEGLDVGVQVGPDPVNQPMIRHWVQAMGDKNPVYTDPEAAAQSVHGGIVAPAVMIQAWVMGGLGVPRDASGTSAQTELLNLLDSAGFTSVVATNSEQEYDRMLRPGDHLQTHSIIESISEEKQTGLGLGHFMTSRVSWSTVEGEPVGHMLWRILKFKPGTGRSAPAAPGADGSEPRPLRPRPSITLDNAFWFDAAREHRLLIQRCDKCGVLRHPTRPRCDKCGSYTWDTVEASGAGTVYSYVVVHHPPIPGFDYPLPIGLIELAEGTRLVAELVGVDAADVEVGMPVEVEWLDHDPDLSLPAFRPAGSRSSAAEAK